MRPPHRVLLALALGLAWLGLARAQEEEASQRFEYVLDDQTELSLDSHPKDARTWTMELRQYGGPEQRLVFSMPGDLRQTSPGHFEYKGEGDHPKTVWVNGRPGFREPLEVTMRNVVYDDQKPVRIHGSFRSVDPILREARTKERSEKTDALVNDSFTRLLNEVGKGGEEKLRDAQRDRLKLRDERAAPTLGDPEAPVKGPGYWESRQSSNLEHLAFLKTWTGRTVAKGIPGSYRQPAGGTLEVSAADEGMTFTITTPRPEGTYPGAITGVARLFGIRAVYKEALSKKETAGGREPAELIFTQHAGHIFTVESKNTDEYAGPGVSLAGDYYKVAPPK